MTDYIDVKAKEENCSDCFRRFTEILLRIKFLLQRTQKAFTLKP
jgi:hypothetical protein